MKSSYEKDRRITGEYDPPLSARNPNPTKEDLQKADEIAEKYRRMKKNRDIATVMPDYPDVIPTHPEWFREDYDKALAEEMEKSKNLSEWTDI